MKKRTTSVALAVAMPRAMTILNGPKFWRNDVFGMFRHVVFSPFS